MRHPYTSVGIAVTIIGLAAGIYSAAAHHSTTMFDRTKKLTLSGTVKEVRWVNPHVTVSVYGTTKDGEEATEWLLETTSPSVLSRVGWSRTSLKPGDRVQVEFSPLMESQAHGGSLRTITSVETGKTYEAGLRAQENTE